MVNIPEQAVQAAARALCRFGTSFSTIEATNSWVDEKWSRFKEEATIALTAAAAHMSWPAREQALEEAETQGNLKQWNIQDHLKTPGSIAEYLQATLDEGDSELLINAVSDVIRALKSKPAPQTGCVE